MKLAELIKYLVFEKIEGDFNDQVELLNITADSRVSNNFGIFIAVKGLNSDGALFADQAVNNGAKVVIYETVISNIIDGICYIKVANTRQAQADAAALIFGFPIKKLVSTGITGTNGKTSFCYILRHILNYAEKKCGLFGNIEYDLGKEKIVPRLNTPESIELQSSLAKMADNGCTHFVMEVSSHGLALDRVRGMEYDCAVFSNLTQDHLDFHVTMADYAQSKALLFNRYLKKDGFAVINADDVMSVFFSEQSKAKVLTYGRKIGSNLLIESYNYNPRGLIVDFQYDGMNFSVESNLEGSFQVYNLAAAVLTAIGHGVDISVIQRSLASDITIPGRLEQVSGEKCKIFVDYAHTPDALEKAVAALKDLNFSQLTIVFGCGGDRDRTKRPLMGQIACKSADKVIITSDNPRGEEPLNIINDIISGIGTFNNYKIVEDRAKAIIEAIATAKENSIILIAGKGHENYQEIKGVKHQFSDQETVKNYLNRK